MRLGIILLVLSTCVLPTNLIAQQNSVLADGNWYQLSVDQSGVYRLTHNDLRSLGIDVDEINPENISLYGYSGGMLPQANSEVRIEDLPQLPITIQGEGDGRFDREDYVMFYAESPDLIELNENGISEYQKNLYSDKSYYFLSIDQGPGLRMTLTANEGTEHPKIVTNNQYFIFEEDLINLIGTGREWYGERLSRNSSSLTIELPFDNIVQGTEIKVTSAVMAQSFGTSIFRLDIDGIPFGDQTMGVIPDAVYDIKGVDRVDVFTSLSPSSNISELTYSFQPASSGTSIGFLNYLMVEATVPLRFSGQQFGFRNYGSTGNPFSTFEVTTSQTNPEIWDVSNPLIPAIQDFTIAGDKLQFGVVTSSLREFVVFSEDELESPELLGAVENQNLHGQSPPDALIITHPDFIAEAERLASFRAINDMLDVSVVTTEKIYNEFSSGRQDITAIRDFIRLLYLKDSRLRYVLLFGDGSYDYKERTIADNTNFVPVYEARNSLHPIFSYSSDDFYGFMDEDEGFWEESELGDHDLEIGVGRLPAKSLQEASIMVDKLIQYATNEVSLGNWRNEVYFVADDGDFNIHQRDADELARFVDEQFTSFNPNKIYLDAFPQASNPDGTQRSSQITEAINDAIEDGSLIFNFTGHGNEDLWCEEEILDQNTIRSWKNQNRLPLFVTATCEFGKYDDPNLVSGGELLLLSEEGGAIGLLTTSRPVFSNTNFLLNRAFYNNIFKRDENNSYPRLGDVIRLTKNESLQGPVNRNFALLGDPMMTLAYPSLQAEITSINGESLSNQGDTLKALGLSTFRGRIVDQNGELVSGFNGNLSIKAFDTPSEILTLGNESVPTSFTQRNSIIFNGQATVSSGEFEFSFVVPKNITYLFEEAKISLYARSDQMIDANGGNLSFKLGGSDSTVPIDNLGPEIEAFLNDQSFRSGDETGPNPLLVANFFDLNGLNISSTGIGQDISIAIDEGEPIGLNNFYISDLDSFQSGTIRYPLKELSEGRHTLTIRAFDTHNNLSEKSLEFFVGNNAKNAISNVISYPNPMRENTTFQISHNRIGENISVQVEIYALNGNLVQTINREIFDSTGTIDDIEWDRRNPGGARVLEGVYVSRIILITDDGASTAHHNLIVID